MAMPEVSSTFDDADQELFGTPFSEGEDKAESESAEDAPTEEEQQSSEPDDSKQEPEPKPAEAAEDDGEEKKGGPLDPQTYGIVKGEREKRREAQAEAELLRERLEALERQVAQRQQPAQEQTQQDPDDLFSDPDSYLSQREQRLKSEFEEREFQRGVMLMKSMRPDYEEKVRVFQERARENPELVRQMNAHPFPAMFAYETGKTYAELGDAKSVEDIERRAYEKAKAELEEKYKREASIKAASEFPKSNAEARAVKGSDVRLPSDEEIDDELFNSPIRERKRR